MLKLFLQAGSLPILLLALLAAGMGVPIPEDPVLLAAGVLAHRTWLPWWAVLPSAYGCAITADVMLYMLGRHFGQALLARAPLRWLLTVPRRAQINALFRKYGTRAVFFGRHLAGVRALLFVFAGIEKMPPLQFIFWDCMAAIITIPVIFSLGFFLSAHVAAVHAGIAHAEHWALAIAAVLGLSYWMVRSFRTRP